MYVLYKIGKTHFRLEVIAESGEDGEISEITIGAGEGMCNYIKITHLNVIAHPCPTSHRWIRSWMSDYIPEGTMGMINHPYSDLSQIMCPFSPLAASWVGGFKIN